MCQLRAAQSASLVFTSLPCSIGFSTQVVSACLWLCVDLAAAPSEWLKGGGLKPQSRLKRDGLLSGKAVLRAKSIILTLVCLIARPAERFTPDNDDALDCR